jgi:hypothetical protein
MFDHIDGVMQAFAKTMTGWKEDFSFTVKVAQQKMSKYYTQVTGTTGMFLISTHIIDCFRTLQLFRQWHKGMDINPEHKTFYTTQYQEAILKYLERNIDVCISVNSKA